MDIGLSKSEKKNLEELDNLHKAMIREIIAELNKKEEGEEF